jgi:hypothetical protein
MTSWPKFVSECKSRFSAIGRSCYLGREKWRERYHESEQTVAQLRGELAEYGERCEQLEQQAREQSARIAELEAQLAEPQPLQLPLGEPPPGQQYGAGLIALSLNLARKIGFRPAVHALEVMWDWLRVEVAVPAYQSIILWMKRLGLGRMTNAQKIEGGVWLADHSNQIGTEKVLTLLRVREPPGWRPGVPLRHQDMEVLAVVPDRDSNRESVKKVYQETAKMCGEPRALLSDYAVELREPLETLGKPGKSPLAVRDPKHFFANRLEQLLANDSRYQEFARKVGGTRSAVQQTELAHFVPPAFKTKARFMNLGRTIQWATVALWHVNHATSESRRGITASRVEEKLGWLRDFSSEIQQWQECQDVISRGLTFLNRQGLYRGVAKRFSKLVADLARSRLSRQLIRDTVTFLREHEKLLRRGEQLPMSTEILESSFALYKQLEQQHSKSGFTSLLLAFPVLLTPTTPAEVVAAFTRVDVKAVHDWAKEKLPNTLASKRQRMYREARKSSKPKRAKSATPKRVAA